MGSRRVHIDDSHPTGYVLCGYELGDGEGDCEYCDKEEKEHDDKIKKELKEKILKFIEAWFVMPFEGTLQTNNEEAKEIHEKITEYNRQKYNEFVIAIETM